MKNPGLRGKSAAMMIVVLLAGAVAAGAQTCTRICCVHHFKIIHGFLDQAVAAPQRARTQTAAEFGATYNRQTAITFLNLTAGELQKAGAHFAAEHDAANQAAVLAMARELTRSANQMQSAKSDGAALAILLHTNLALRIPAAVAPVKPAAPGTTGKTK